MATITVNGTTDDVTADSTLSLREAILVANGALAVSGLSALEQAQVSGVFTSPAPDTIAFAIPGAGVHTIRPPLDLPAITDPVIIDGYTQPGSSPNTNPITTGSNAVILIELDGTLDRVNDFGRGTGLRINSGNTTVRGLAINRFTAAAINAASGDGNTISGNIIGLDPAGAVAYDDPAGVRGLLIQTSNNRIGGTEARDRNIISGSSGGDFFGIFIGGGSPTASAGNLIQGNFIGTDASGTLARVFAGAGVVVSSSVGTTIGGTTLAERNLISGNRKAGVYVDGGRDVQVMGNLIGTDVTGLSPLGNIQGIFFNAHTPSTIGGTAQGAGNVIAGNPGGGIEVYFTNGHTIQGNLIGTDISGTHAIGNGFGVFLHGGNDNTIGGPFPGAPNVIAHSTSDGVQVGGSGNRILENSIFENGSFSSKGIVYPSPLARPPVLSSATSSQIKGTVSGEPNKTLRLEFFATPVVAGSSAVPQGKAFLGTIDVSTDNAGMADFTFSPPGGIPIDQPLTATSTGTPGTSEFANAILAVADSTFDYDIRLADNIDPIAAGQILTYTIVVGLTGNPSSTGLTVASSVPLNTSFVSFSGPDGFSLSAPAFGGTGAVTAFSDHEASGVFSLVVRVASNVAAGTTLSATASVASATNDSDSSNDSAAESTLVIAAPIAAADVSIHVSVAPDPVDAGAELTYSLLVDNSGPDSADAMVVAFAIPTGTTFVRAFAPEGWTLTEPPVGSGGTLMAVYRFAFLVEDGSGHLSVTVRVADGTAGGTIIKGTATITASTADDIQSNNTHSAAATVATAPTAIVDLNVTLTDAPLFVTVGQTAAYSILVTNSSATAATSVTLKWQLPVGVEFVSATTGSFDQATRIISAGLATIMQGAPVPITIVLRPTVAGIFTQDIDVAGAESDPNGVNNQVVVNTTAQASSTPVNGPVVTLLERIGVHAQPTRLVLTFDTALDRHSALSKNSFRLVAAGRDGKLGTRDDRRIALRSISLSPSGKSLTLRPSVLLSLSRRYQLTINGLGAGGLADTGGRLLDGDGNGAAGGAFVATITRATLAGTSPAIRSKVFSRSTQPR